MKIEDLYLELGRAMTEKVMLGKEIVDTTESHRQAVRDLQQEQQNIQKTNNQRSENLSRHIEEVEEAIRLVTNGTDPFLAKLTAKESLEDKREQEKVLNAILKYSPPVAATMQSNQVPYNNTGVMGTYLANQTFSINTVPWIQPWQTK